MSKKNLEYGATLVRHGKWEGNIFNAEEYRIKQYNVSKSSKKKP